MKTVFKFTVQLIVGFFMFVFGPFISRSTDKLFDIEHEELESQFVGKTATVVECVTLDSGMVRFMGATWKARLLPDCLESTLAPGTVVTIAKTEGNVLYVY